MSPARLLATLLLALLPAAPVLAQPSLQGAWTRAPNLSFVPIHVHLLPTGKVLLWGASGVPHTWDPAAPGPGVPAATAPYNLFCAGHAFLPDGRLLVAGGHIANNWGEAKLTLYDPVANTWTLGAEMGQGRWYPTATTLGNGDVLVVSGDISTASGVNPLPQVWQHASGSWRNLTGATLSQALYPMMFLAPNGKVFEAGPTATTRYLDTAGSGAWTPVATRTDTRWRDYGSAVMYEDGKILTMGGADPPTGSAETIDLNAPSPTWRATQPLWTPRRQINATVLPDSSVLVTGGTAGAGFNNTATAVFQAELWNPATGAWSVMASATVPRWYHSSALLLPDGRVMTSGSDGWPEVEIFSPPYLFKGGTRPAITAAPDTIAWGQPFTVQATASTPIAKVTLVRLGSVTHAIDMNQRLNVLPFTPGAGGLTVTPPASGNQAPPGHYMLFVLDGNGVPSVAKIVRLGAAADPGPDPGPVPGIAALSPSSATAGGPAFTLTVTGTNFVAGSVVRWNGAARPTTYVGATQLTAAIPASDIAAAGTAQVSVANSATAVSGNAAFTVTAAPAGPSRRLTVTRTGTAASRGTVTSTPAGISCGGTCTATFAGSSPTVTLSIVTNGNGVFAGWGGACSASGTQRTCTLTLQADATVSATINRR